MIRYGGLGCWRWLGTRTLGYGSVLGLVLPWMISFRRLYETCFSEHSRKMYHFRACTRPFCAFRPFGAFGGGGIIPFGDMASCSSTHIITYQLPEPTCLFRHLYSYQRSESRT
ncbi:hypothetical protein K491DRAFT_397258 [Lophiostoma macrostomum CBS 122681]|uniref:Uncharacterized protein n=1 Tax=Lophiostoma macrostomum CBS 122681 TaxID=1314788 RepID=A0A6A6TC96_9PLEO|nr:hypothetical protein K491DRAFT_397258 [Lophiostoma macrostomum CBS 122681]